MDQSLAKRCYELLLGSRADAVLKRVALWLALVGFGLHLLAWLLNHWNVLDPPPGFEPLLASPLLALYTPFSILLVYEVYQLIQAIPRSFSSAMAKQFEVIALIVVRSSLEFLAVTDTTGPAMDGSRLLLLAAKCLAFLALLGVIVGFTRIEDRYRVTKEITSQVASYIRTKYFISTLLSLIFAATVGITFVSWLIGVFSGDPIRLHSGIFFSDFFTFLIVADITILLISYRFTSDFGGLARNTGFVLSTVLMRIAIDSSGITAPLLFILSGLVGLGVLWITNQFPRRGVAPSV